jgi:hypothetical protein
VQDHFTKHRVINQFCLFFFSLFFRDRFNLKIIHLYCIRVFHFIYCLKLDERISFHIITVTYILSNFKSLRGSLKIYIGFRYWIALLLFCVCLCSLHRHKQIIKQYWWMTLTASVWLFILWYVYVADNEFIMNMPIYWSTGINLFEICP